LFPQTVLRFDGVGRKRDRIVRKKIQERVAPALDRGRPRELALGVGHRRQCRRDRLLSRHRYREKSGRDRRHELPTHTSKSSLVLVFASCTPLVSTILNFQRFLDVFLICPTMQTL
jgi:hypothetical protein